MTGAEIKAINDERLGEWNRLLLEEHSTPFVLFGMGHDQNNGQLVMCIPEKVPTHVIVTCLRFALRRLLTERRLQ